MVDDAAGSQPRGRAQAERLRAILGREFGFVWRTLRRLGVARDDADDAAQGVFLVLSQRLEGVAPELERSFLFGTVVRVASESRRAVARRAASELRDDTIDAHAAPSRPADELVDDKRALEQVDRILDEMPTDLRVAFVLHELEGLSLPEIAATVGVPLGTATSRLRRAREMFRERTACFRTDGPPEETP